MRRADGSRTHGPALRGGMLAAPMLLACGVGLAACGGGGRAGTGTATRARTTSGADRSRAIGESPGASAAAKRSVTTAQALAFARAVNLRAPDLPGFKVSSERHQQETPSEKRLQRQLAHCADTLSANYQVAEASSQKFEREENGAAQSVQSGVTVMQTPALAARELAAMRSKRGRECLSRFATALFKAQKYEAASVGPVSVSSGSPPAPGVTGSFGLRITTALVVHHVAIPFYLDFLGFVDGPAEVSLDTFGVPAAFPAATEEGLYRTLLSRSKTHRL